MISYTRFLQSDYYYPQEKEITFTKLIAMENKIDTIIEAQIEKILKDIECDSTIIDDQSVLEDDILFPDDCSIPQDEIDEILATCANFDKEEHDRLSVSIKFAEYTGQSDLISSTTEAIFNCHLCGEFSTKCFSDLYNHLSNHLNGMVLKVSISFPFAFI